MNKVVVVMNKVVVVVVVLDVLVVVVILVVVIVFLVFLRGELHHLNQENRWEYLPPKVNNLDLPPHLHLLQMEVHPNSEFHRQHRNLVFVIEFVLFPPFFL